ncbi:uncharacterized protein NEMAJ01_1083 [Nematocida major]|uniref:uncharacterized protein n=1 Tax=Nematocida major TaxID=1912982 RepID=UPI0020076DDF|nr:uncharacterized protein NEMAJ01_1083 [Nematocida major]KAH9386187.1 hypothetical protein NEMAJ01_1083 [Nematocida major]
MRSEEVEKTAPIVSLRTPPTALCMHGSMLAVSHKSGEVCSVNMETMAKKVLSRNTSAATAICHIEGILLIGTRKGEIRVVVDKRGKQLAKRHSAQIISIHTVKTENDETEVLTASADRKVLVWKLDISEFKGAKVVNLLFLKALYGPTTPIKSTSLSAGKRLLLCTSEISETIRVFRLEKDTQLLFHLKQGFAVLGAFLDNERFVVVSDKNVLYIFNINRTEPDQALELPESGVSALSVLSAKRALVGLSDGRILDIQIEETASIKKTMCVNAIPNAFLQSGSSLYVAGGKEEKHARFFINKTVRNGVFKLE